MNVLQKCAKISAELQYAITIVVNCVNRRKKLRKKEKHVAHISGMACMIFFKLGM